MSAAKKAPVKEPEHALLNASGAHRWLVCTPSARLEETLEEKTSEDAEKGCQAHSIAELKLRKYFLEPMGAKTYNSRLKKLQESPYYEESMMRNTDLYLEYVQKIVHSYAERPYIGVEKRVEYGIYAPEGFGTSDCIIIGGETMYVIDYKNGKGKPVSAFENVQMKLYGLGAYHLYGFLFSIKKAVLVIIQPNVWDEPSEWEISIEELLAWGESIIFTAQMAFDGKGEFIQGDHCQFCRAKALCRARATFNLGLEEYHMLKPPLISDEEVGQILQRAQNLAAWAKNLEDYALAQCLAGNTIPGWKAVHGTSKRAWLDQDGAFNLLKATGTNETMLYTREPLSLAKVEELIGKKQFKEQLAQFVNTPPGKPTLVPESDKREAIKQQSAAEIFKAADEERRNENE